MGRVLISISAEQVLRKALGVVLLTVIKAIVETMALVLPAL